MRTDVMLRLAVLATLAVLPIVRHAVAAPANLPAPLTAVREQVIAISRANTTRDDNIKAVRAQLEPLIAQLAEWFDANRPGTEVSLTQKPWKSIWYDDPTIDEFSNGSFGGISLRLDRSKVYQVVENGYYYNVSESTLTSGRARVKFQTYLKGAYAVARPATPANTGEARLNVVDLEFVYNGIRFGPLPEGIDLRRLVKLADARVLPGLQRVPGPIGITGELWNLYIDDELRISAGFEDDKRETIDLYILLRADRTGPLSSRP